MGCHYFSSDEYEAALIAERRRAGAYRSLRWHRAGQWVMFAIAGAAALLTLPFVW